MTPAAFLTVGVLMLLAIVAFALRRIVSEDGGGLDLGAVSTRWLSELRRDEPWSGSARS